MAHPTSQRSTFNVTVARRAKNTHIGQTAQTQRRLPCCPRPELWRLNKPFNTILGHSLKYVHCFGHGHPLCSCPYPSPRWLRHLILTVDVHTFTLRRHEPADAIHPALHSSSHDTCQRRAIWCRVLPSGLLMQPRSNSSRFKRATSLAVLFAMVHQSLRILSVYYFYCRCLRNIIGRNSSIPEIA